MRYIDNARGFVTSKEQLKKIGERIKELRKEKGYTQKDMLDKLNCKYNTYIDAEKGRKLPRLDDALILCEEFGCDMEYLLCQDDSYNEADRDIRKRTGLSSKAIKMLELLKEELNSNQINELLENRMFIDAMLLSKTHRENILKFHVKGEKDREDDEQYNMKRDFGNALMSMIEDDIIKIDMNKKKLKKLF